MLSDLRKCDSSFKTYYYNKFANDTVNNQTKQIRDLIYIRLVDAIEQFKQTQEIPEFMETMLFLEFAETYVKDDACNFANEKNRKHLLSVIEFLKNDEIDRIKLLEKKKQNLKQNLKMPNCPHS